MIRTKRKSSSGQNQQITGNKKLNQLTRNTSLTENPFNSINSYFVSLTNKALSIEIIQNKVNNFRGEKQVYHPSFEPKINYYR